MREDELYVGYLPVPARQKRFLRVAVPAMLWLLCGVCLLWARSQRSPGTAVWDQSQPVKLHGTLIGRPYPMLLTSDAGGNPDLILLVEMGKHGARAAGLDGRRVTVSGWPLHRDGRRMIELEPDEKAVAPDAGASRPEPIPVVEAVGRVTLRGEVVDSKCFLGAMKPGEGKTHKECATLCIRGGIPPMLVTRDPEGRATYYLLRAPDGGPVDPAILPFVADPVEVSGDLSTLGGLQILTVGAGDIRRL